MANSIHDITLVVALRIDSEFRERNYDFHKKYWGNMDVKVIYVLDEGDGIFHRTKMFNDGLRHVHTRYAAITDVDCIFDLYLLQKSIEEADEKTFVIPFNNVKHRNIEGEVLFEWANAPTMNKETLDRYFYTGNFNTIIDYNNMELPSFEASCGLCGVFQMDMYKSCGFENENCVDYAFEDIERIVRMRKLGMNVKWLEGTGYHLFHPNDSRKKNKLFRNNFFEYLKICDMEKEEIQEYINSWKRDSKAPSLKII